MVGSRPFRCDCARKRTTPGVPMMRRVWLLACGLGIGLLPGCLHTAATELPAGLLFNVNPPPRMEVDEEPPSPYDARSTPLPGKGEVIPASAVACLDQSEPTAPAPVGLPAEGSSETSPQARGTSEELPATFISNSLSPSSDAVRPVRAEAAVKAEDPLVSVLRCYRERRKAEGLARLEKFDPAARTALTALVPLISRISDGKVDQSHMAEQLDLIARQLRPNTALDI